MNFALNRPALQTAGQILHQQCHAAAVANGWWNDPATGARIERNVGEDLMLVTSQLTKALEGHRMGLQDARLPARTQLEVKLAGAVMRIFDMAESQGFDLGATIAEMIVVNQARADHKPAARLAVAGKKY